jgi:hypothetical protein
VSEERTITQRLLDVDFMSLSESQRDDFAFCLDADKHTPHPTMYLKHHRWMDEMRKTHTVTQCNTCGRWAIWKKK